MSISYEFDPTDILKMPELLAKSRDEKYVKSENEDFVNLLRGIMGTKKRIHIQVNGVLEKEVNQIASEDLNQNEKLGRLTELVDEKIWQGYKLWPSNFIAYDLLHKEDKFKQHYTPEEKASFEKRLQDKIDTSNPVIVENFLSMYAYPVINQLKLS